VGGESVKTTEWISILVVGLAFAGVFFMVAVAVYVVLGGAR
jgi:hypothetical protein